MKNGVFRKFTDSLTQSSGGDLTNDTISPHNLTKITNQKPGCKILRHSLYFPDTVQLSSSTFVIVWNDDKEA